MRRRTLPRTRHGLDLWAQLGVLAVGVAVSLFAVVAVLSTFGLSPR